MSEQGEHWRKKHLTWVLQIILWRAHSEWQGILWGRGLRWKWHELVCILKGILVSVVKNSPANAQDSRDSGLLSGSGKSPEVGNGNPLQYSCLENPMDRRAWWAPVHGIAQNLTWLSGRSRVPSTGCVENRLDGSRAGLGSPDRGPWHRSREAGAWPRQGGPGAGGENCLGSVACFLVVVFLVYLFFEGQSPRDLLMNGVWTMREWEKSKIMLKHLYNSKCWVAIYWDEKERRKGRFRRKDGSFKLGQFYLRFLLERQSRY